VREYIFRQGVKTLARLKNLSPKIQEEVALQDLTAALSEDDKYLTPGFKSELLADGMHRLGQIPLEHCALCKRPVFTHKAKIVNDRFYCETCAPKPTQT
jgi:hypothetical protein